MKHLSYEMRLKECCLATVETKRISNAEILIMYIHPVPVVQWNGESDERRDVPRVCAWSPLQQVTPACGSLLGFVNASLVCPYNMLTFCDCL